jgi:hypothetical protein
MVVMVAFFVSMVVMVAFFISMVVMLFVRESDVVRHVLSVDFNIVCVIFFIDQFNGFVWPF